VAETTTTATGGRGADRDLAVGLPVLGGLARIHAGRARGRPTPRGGTFFYSRLVDELLGEGRHHAPADSSTTGTCRQAWRTPAAGACAKGTTAEGRDVRRDVCPRAPADRVPMGSRVGKGAVLLVVRRLRRGPARPGRRRGHGASRRTPPPGRERAGLYRRCAPPAGRVRAVGITVNLSTRHPGHRRLPADVAAAARRRCCETGFTDNACWAPGGTRAGRREVCGRDQQTSRSASGRRPGS